MNQRRLTLMMGLPRSGKTTEAHKIREATGAAIVSPDGIRLGMHGTLWNPAAETMVWSVAHYMVHGLFHAGHDHVILDACSVSRKRREIWNQGALWDVDIVWVKTAASVCDSRVRNQQGLTHDQRLGLWRAIERMRRATDIPSPEEKVRIVTGVRA